MALYYHCSIKSDEKPIKKQCFLKCWLLLAIDDDDDAIHFVCLHDHERLVIVIKLFW